jgi:hypothetical protein
MKNKQSVSAKRYAASLVAAGILFAASTSIAGELGNSSINRICACIEQGKDRNCNPLAATRTDAAGGRGDAGRHEDKRD